jgi:hypothetical protein
MTRRVGITSVFLGLGASCLGGCLPGSVHDRDSVNTADVRERFTPAPNAPDPPSAYHVQQPPPPPPPSEDKPVVEPVAQTHFPGDPFPGLSAPSVKAGEPPAPFGPPSELAPPIVQAEKAPPESPLLTAFRSLLANRSADALEQLQSYDAASREMLMTLLPMAARVGDGGLNHSTPQETAVLLEQLRTLEGVLRPRSALALNQARFCRKINGFGDYQPWPDDHVFQAGTADQRGERMQVYVEVGNFASRLNGTTYETSLGGVVEIRDSNNKAVSRMDFPPRVVRSQTPRADYFLNFQFYLPAPLPEGRYTLNVLVKDVLDPATGDAASRNASRTLNFTVGAPDLSRVGGD